MRKVDQRFWDAMIIKAWNDFDTCNNLIERCYAEFGDAPYNLPLLRNTSMHGGVRSWVDSQLHLLSEKLWILPKNRQIELLDWLAHNKINCETYKKATRHIARARSAAKWSGMSMGRTIYEAKVYKEGASRMAQVNVVKPVRSKA